MEILKKLTGLFGLLLISISINAQSTDGIIKAFSESYILESKGEYSNAIAKLKAVYNEDSYELNLRLGWLSYQSGLFNDSKALYNKAILLKPYAIEPKFGITYPAAAVGKWDEVMNQYKNIIKIDPNNTVAHYKIGLIFYGRQDYKSSEYHFAKIVNLYPFDHDSLLMLAWTKFRLLDFGKAIVLFNKVLMYNPNDESAKEGLSLMD